LDTVTPENPMGIGFVPSIDAVCFEIKLINGLSAGIWVGGRYVSIVMSNFTVGLYFFIEAIIL
jgi:hypothetical protein